MDKKIWENPTDAKFLDQSHVPFWFWNDKLEDEELIRQMKLMTGAGVKGVDPHIRSFFGNGYIGRYLGDDYFSNIKTVIDYKMKYDELLWIYDEVDWPSGTCSKTVTKDERYREYYLNIERIFIPAGKKFRAQLSFLTGFFPFRKRDSEADTPSGYNIAVIDAETLEPYDNKRYIQSGSLSSFSPDYEFKSDRDAIAFVIQVHTNAYDQDGDNQVSYINGEATEEFIKLTYEKYYDRFPDAFGTTLKCFFNDETRFANAIQWTEDFPGEFRKRKGYDILPKLYQLITPGIEAGRTRCDYLDVIAALYQENFFGKINKWCNDHKVGLSAHLLGEETLHGQTRYSGDYLRQNKYIYIPASDHLGKGIGSLNVKYTACGAHSYGMDNTAIEIFAGTGWNFTFEEYIRMVTWAFQQGMKTIINHGFFYSTRGERVNDWPPSTFFQWQDWERMKEANALTRRLHYAMTGGRPEADILIYNPIESFWFHYIPNQHFTHGFSRGPLLESEQAIKLDREMQLLMNGLSSENLDFDIIHKDAVENFRVKGSRICNKLNGQEFSILILPMCEILPIEMARLCNQYIDCGGVIVALDSIPTMAMPASCDSELNDIFNNIKSTKRFILLNVENKNVLYDEIRKVIPVPVSITAGTAKTINTNPAYGPYLIDPYIHDGEDLSGVLFVRYLKENRRNTLFMNYSDKPEAIEVGIKTPGEVPEVWNTFNGTISKAELINKTSDGYIVKLELPCNYGVFLISEI